MSCQITSTHTHTVLFGKKINEKIYVVFLLYTLSFTVHLSLTISDLVCELATWHYVKVVFINNNDNQKALREFKPMPYCCDIETPNHVTYWISQDHSLYQVLGL